MIGQKYVWKEEANEMQNDIAKFKTTSLGQDKNSNFAPAKTQPAHGPRAAAAAKTRPN